MKKFSLLLSVVVLTLIIDGVLTYDIFEFKIDTFWEWLTLGLILVVIGTIYWVETGKKNDN
ncbi:MAG: hypothetical protein ACE5G9_12600 [Nitrospinales bacterium]